MKHLKLSRSALIRVGEGKPFEKQHRTVNRGRWVTELNLQNIGEGKGCKRRPSK